jgi:IS66 C-terminal element
MRTANGGLLQAAVRQSVLTNAPRTRFQRSVPGKRSGEYEDAPQPPIHPGPRTPTTTSPTNISAPSPRRVLGWPGRRDRGRREEFSATKARRHAAGGAEIGSPRNVETETRTAWSPTATQRVAGRSRTRQILVHFGRRRALCQGSPHELDRGRTGQEQDRLPQPNYVNDQDNITSPAECEPTCRSNDLHPGMSCKRAGVEVLDYLADVLVRVAAHPASKIDQLLPMSRAKGSLSRPPRRPSRKPRSSWMQAAPLDTYDSTAEITRVVAAV